MSKYQNFYYEIRWTQLAPTPYVTLSLDDRIEQLLSTHDMAAAKEVIEKIKQQYKL